MAASVLVVSNPEDRDAILDPLRKAGVSDVLARDGSDDTLALCARARPDVVIVSARLEQGDARAFISAMREIDLTSGPTSGPTGEQGGPRWSPRVILIGELDGPLRTPLDVSDLHVDHFLGQPLSPKALVFATRSAMAAATSSAGTRGGPEAKPEAKIGAKPEAKIGAKPEAKIGARPEARSGAKPDASPETKVSPETEALARPAAAAGVGPARSAGAASEPAPAWRARTEILPDGAVSPAGPAPAAGRAASGHPATDDAEAEWQQSMEPAGGSFVGPIVVSSVVQELTPLPAPVPFLDEESDDDLDDFDLQIEVDIGAELEADLAQPLARSAPAASRAARPTAAPQAGEDTFASELQRKMSAMEERLLSREARAPAAPAAVPAAADVAAEVRAAAPAEVPMEGAGEVIDGVSESVPRSEPGARDAARPEPADSAPRAVGGPAAASAHPDEPGQGILRRGHGDFASLLERMYRERFTGRVLLRRRLAEKTIVFQHGRPVFATSNQPEDRLGALLARAGKITDEQAELSHRRALDTGKRLGEVLVEKGFLKRRELLPAVRLQLEEIIYSLFAWDQGEYTVVPGEPEPGERIRLSTHPGAMVLEGVRRKYSPDVLVEIVGPPESALEIIDPTQRDTLMSVADLSPAERDIALAFDGVRTLAEIAERSRMGRLAVYQLAYALIAFGAARVRRPGDAPDVDAGAWPGHGPDGDAAGEGDGEADLGIDRKRIQAKHALVDEADYFAILGVRRDATSFEIQRAYEAACRDYAPGEVSPALRQELERELAEIREVLDEAYQVLRDDALRSSYLTHLRD
jgi:DNA-binding NarL/FixJ family response regulator